MFSLSKTAHRAFECRKDTSGLGRGDVEGVGSLIEKVLSSTNVLMHGGQVRGVLDEEGINMCGGDNCPDGMKVHGLVYVPGGNLEGGVTGALVVGS